MDVFYIWIIQYKLKVNVYSLSFEQLCYIMCLAILVHACIRFHSYRIVKAYEDLVSFYTQKIHENEQQQIFNFTSLILVTERVSS